MMYRNIIILLKADLKSLIKIGKVQMWACSILPAGIPDTNEKKIHYKNLSG